ncbi:MAG: hypothetical protein IJ657_02155, partial [Acidaminococcaceae bacterium]|nr:hypothetical protein [Acidaminococcaceae bacterium]
FYAKTLTMSGAEKIMQEKEKDETYRCRWLEKERMSYVSYMEDEVPYSFWQEDKISLEHKMGLIKTYSLAGVASWRYGFEKPEIWPMLEEKLKEAEPVKETTPKPDETANQNKAKSDKKNK